jgi:chromosome segregation ATPase
MSQMQRPGPYDPTHRGTGGTEPPDPTERLKQLQAELAQHNSRINYLTNQATALQTDISDLTTSVTQVQGTVTSYGAGLSDLQSRLQALQYFYDQKSKMILAAIGDKKGPIDDLIRDFDYELDRMHDRLMDLGEKLAAATKESEEAANLQTVRQNEYNAVNAYQQNVTGKLSDMETLRGDITQADDNTDVASMYFLVLEFHSRLRETHIISQNQLSTELRLKLGELEAAKEQARAKAAALSAVTADYTAQQTALQTKRTGRRAALLAAVQALFPAPPPSTSTSGTGATGTSTSSGSTSATPATGTTTPASPSAATPTAATPSTATPSPATTPKP